MIIVWPSLEIRRDFERFEKGDFEMVLQTGLAQDIGRLPADFVNQGLVGLVCNRHTRVFIGVDLSESQQLQDQVRAGQQDQTRCPVTRCQLLPQLNFVACC
eukprot:Protomagalhaensia_wolfi_Nauph_80__3827@NODE_3877_length_688_cov_26_722650_g3063_i0_p1_GENE_NODE_3877_length_688_cov_26_722650_g3063_i0NODE_3877_length_688_cov_26_722650_g3063_i0_p1_ORF_typecomplete_len101_score9_05_NODE_3877_length_688_cov_26_722650_g3063_i0145447